MLLKIVFWLLIIIAALFLLYLLAIWPRTRRRKLVEPFMSHHFAHRGLWNMKNGVPENSMEAFRLAVEAGYAIELDIHLAADGVPVVFHDDDLYRLCGRPEAVESLSSNELCQLYLAGTDQQIPLFSQVLDLVAGRVPLLVELKLPTMSTALCSVANDMLSTYSGPYIIESFQPFGLRWFRKHNPSVLLGQLACRHKPGKGVDAFMKWASKTLIVNLISRPDFVAYNHLHMNGLGIRLMKNLFRIPVFAWTVRSQEAFEHCRKRRQSVIFEQFIPEEPV